MPATIEDYARALADGIVAAIPGWVVACVERVMLVRVGHLPPEVARAAAAAGEQARAEMGPAIRQLLEADIDQQRSTPLAMLRVAVRYPTLVLHEASVVPAARDRFAVEAFPDDDYDLSPAALADVSPSLTALGITWGAAKAFEHKRRHRRP